MADHTFTGSIDAPADEVWNAVRDFTDGSWTGVEMKTDGEGLGASRTISMGSGSITEKCERLDDDARVMGYTITEGAGLPFEDYHSTMTVNPAGDGAELVWKATYEPVGARPRPPRPWMPSTAADSPPSRSTSNPDPFWGWGGQTSRVVRAALTAMASAISARRGAGRS